MSLSVMEILNRVRSGDITVAEGAASLEALEGQGEAPAGGDALSTASENRTADEKPWELEIGWWKYAWLIVFGAGTAVFVLGAWLIGWAYPNGRMFWFYCAWLPLLVGLAVLLIGVWSRFARWVHVRVHEVKGARIAISLPVPVYLLSLGIRLFGSRIKGLQGQDPADIATLLTALGKTHDPISVEVDEKDGDRVRVYIL